MSPGELIVYQDAYRTLALAINRGDAAGTLGARRRRRGAAAAAMIGTPRVHHRLTDSTNERAKELAAAGAPHGTLVTADEQSAGRGRQGRVWTAPAGSAVLMSLVLRELDELLPLTAAVAICEALPAERRAIKWPNDVWIERPQGRRDPGRGTAAGGLGGAGGGAERDDGRVPARSSRRRATSLRLAGVETDPAARARRAPRVAVAVARALRARRCWPPGVARDALKGERVRWSGGEGIADGIDDSGALRVDTRDGQVTLDAGEVHLLR